MYEISMKKPIDHVKWVAEVAAYVTYDLGIADPRENIDFLGDTIVTLGTDWVPEGVTAEEITERFNRIAWAKYKELVGSNSTRASSENTKRYNAAVWAERRRLTSE